MWAANFDVESTDGEKHYLVQFHRADPPSCTCPAYMYSGDYGQQDCKHIKIVTHFGCFYAGEQMVDEWLGDGFEYNGIKLLSHTKDVTDRPCPGCGKPMIEVRITT